ncbi:MAG: restriction endonuclease subunit S, partial [Azonexus sp.]|nr:restriction endonuclease subunit S [Azonexus sp.]
MAEQTASKVPQIRFKGFDGKWEEKITGDLCGEFHSGKFISASEIAEIGEYPVYGGNGLRGFSAKYNHDGLYALIGRQGALCGNMNLFSGKAFLTEHAVAVQANTNNDTFFLYYLFGRMNLGQYSSQSAQPGLAVNKLQKLSSWVCTKTEQTQIGAYFRELDSLIGLHQRKHDKLVTLKKAMLQKMFPQPGAATPEIRFKGFSGDWVAKKLGDLIDLGSGRDYKHLSPGDIPVYGTGGYMLSVNEALSASMDSVGIGRKGTIDKPYILRAPFWTVDTLFYAIPKAENYLDFVYCIFQRIDWKQKDESTGVPSLSKVAINGVSVIATNPQEQHKIGT